MNKKITAITISAVLIRIAAIFALGRHINPQVWEYDTIAINLIHGNGYLYSHFNTQYHSLGYPLYPFLCAFFHYMTHQNYLVIELLQAAASGATCYFVYLMGAKLFDEPAGLAAAFMTAIHPGLIVYSTSMHELSLVALLISVVVWMGLSFDHKKASSCLIIGAVAGLGMLARPTFLFFLPAYFVFLWISAGNIRRIIKPVVIVCLAAMLVIAPWTIRNFLTHKRLIFITTSSAEHFWRGNNPNASGTSLTTDNRPILDTAPAEFRERLFKLDEMGQYDLFYGETMKHVGAHPFLFVRATLKKMGYFWWFSPQTGLLYPAAWKTIYGLYYIPVFAFFIIGLSLALVQPRPATRHGAMLIALFCAFISIVHGFYYIEMRHRWAIEPLMLVFSAYGFLEMLRYLKFKMKKGRAG